MLWNIVFFVGGLLTLIWGRAKADANRWVYGAQARVAGLWLMLPLVIDMLMAVTRALQDPAGIALLYGNQAAGKDIAARIFEGVASMLIGITGYALTVRQSRREADESQRPVYITRDESVIGQYPVLEIPRQLQARTIQHTDLFWMEGMSVWLPLSDWEPFSRRRSSERNTHLWWHVPIMLTVLAAVLGFVMATKGRQKPPFTTAHATRDSGLPAPMSSPSSTRPPSSASMGLDLPPEVQALLKRSSVPAAPAENPMHPVAERVGYKITLFHFGVSADSTDAKAKLQLPAAKGVSAAQWALATLQFHDDPDSTEGVELLHQAAKNGQRWAQMQLAMRIFARRSRLPSGAGDAITWLEKAALQESTTAQVWTAKFYALGWGGAPMDPSRAVAWYTLWDENPTPKPDDMEARQTMMLLKSMLPASESGQPQKIASNLRSKTALANHPKRFRYQYNYAPDPGPRHWTRLGDVWTERLPDGSENRFWIAEKITVNGKQGALLYSVNRSGMEVFVPDRGPEKSQLLFRNDPVGSGEVKWSLLNVMESVE